MTRSEAEDYIYASYLRGESQRDYSAPDSMKRDPSPTASLIRELSGDSSVVVTGSKGKGSVAMMLSLILGTRRLTGLLTSPHLIDFCERFRVGGVAMTDAEFISNLLAVKPRLDSIDSSLPAGKFISPMGIQTAVALHWFRSVGVQTDILECGKGARFDDVNNAVHQYAVINTVFREHTRELGSTIAEIAADKAHVITPATKRVFVAPQCDEAMDPILARAAEFRCGVSLYGHDFRAVNISFSRSGMAFDVIVGKHRFENLSLPLLGDHQARNCALALAVALEMDPSLDHDDVAAAVGSMRWPGRMEIVSDSPFVMIDACINRESAMAVKDVISRLGIDRCNMVIGIPCDKDFRGVAAVMAPVASEMILTKSSNPHYRFSSAQADEVGADGIGCVWNGDMPAVVGQCMASGLPTVILGTTSLVADAETIFGQHGLMAL